MQTYKINGELILTHWKLPPLQVDVFFVTCLPHLDMRMGKEKSNLEFLLLLLRGHVWEPPAQLLHMHHCGPSP